MRSSRGDVFDPANVRLTGGLIAGLPLLAGSILQSVYASTDTTFSTTNAVFGDITGLSVTLAPLRNVNSKVILLGVVQLASSGGGATGVYVKMLKDGADFDLPAARGARTPVRAMSDINAGRHVNPSPIFGYDAPADTIAHTYKLQYAAQQAGLTGYVNRSASDDNASYAPDVKSWLLALEIGGTT